MGLPIVINNSIMPLNSAKPALSLSVPVKQLPFSPLLPEARKFKPIDFFQNHPKLQSNFNINMDKYFDRPLFTSYEFTKNAIIQKAKLRQNTNNKPFDTKENIELLEEFFNENIGKKIIKYNLLDLKDETGKYKYNIPEILTIAYLKEPVFELFKERIFSDNPVDIAEIFKFNDIVSVNLENLFIKGKDAKVDETKLKDMKLWKEYFFDVAKELIELKRPNNEYIFTKDFFNFFLFFNSLKFCSKKIQSDLAKAVLERIINDSDFNFETDFYVLKLTMEKFATYKENMKKRNLFLEKTSLGEYKYTSKQIKNVALLSDSEFEKFKQREEYDFNGEKWDYPLEPYITVELTKLSSDNIKFLEENGILEAFRKHKILEETFRDICHTLNNKEELSETVLKDVELLKQGKTSSVIEFKEGTSQKEILKNTSQADVVKVGGSQLYINNKNKLIPFDMSKEKFDKLFPIIDRFATAQGELGNCYFVAAIIAMMNNPYTRPYIFLSFKEGPEEIISCTLRSYKDYFGTIPFTKGRVDAAKRSLYGTKGMKMLEETYANVALRENDNNLKNNSDDLLERIESGNSADVLSELLGLEFTKVLSEKEFKKLNFFENKRLKHSSLVVKFTNKKLIEEYLSKYGNDKNVINIISWDDVEDLPITNKGKMYTNHCYVIDSYNPERKTIKVISAWEGVDVFELPLKSLKNVQFSMGNIEQKK